LTHCENRKDRFAILDGPPPGAFPNDVNELTQVGQVAPKPTRKRATADAGEGDGGDDGSGGPAAPTGPAGFRPRSSERGFGAFYVPHLRVVHPLVPGEMIDVPPSGHVAGAYARTDTQRGVHQPPANTPLPGVGGLTRNITSAEQAVLNPEGVNCIRYFGGDGILIWGARTVASDPEWRYVNVRRLFSFVEQTILRNTRWAVFEANSEPLWKSIDRTITAFLMRVWRSGALVGSTPEQAFFVQCDAETNPPELRDNGVVRTVVGMAPVKPAEFVVFEISQHNDGLESVSEGAG
jgi:phage tail sheath protein FI